MPRVTIGPDGNYELEPKTMLSLSTKLVSHVQALCEIVANAESEQELETIAAHVGDVVTKARDRILSITKVDQRLMSVKRGVVPRALEWEYDDDGEWTSSSTMGHDGMCFFWRIDLHEDGTFDVSNSDSELTPPKSQPVSCFPTLAAAKAHCQERENEMVADSVAGLLCDDDSDVSFD